MSQVKRLAMAVAGTALVLVVLFFFVRRAPDSVRSLFSA